MKTLKAQISQLIYEYPKRYSQLLLLHEYENLNAKLMQATRFLDECNDSHIQITIGTRIWYLLNDILSSSQLKRCKYCGKFLVRRHIITDKIEKEKDFCNKTCKNQYYKNLRNDISNLSEKDTKYWKIKYSLTTKEAIIKVRQYKPQYIDFWIRLGYSQDEAEQKRKNYMNKARIEYWFYRGYSQEESEQAVQNEIYQRKTKRKKCPEYWIELGYSKEDAILKAKDEILKANPTYFEYWLCRGYSQEEAQFEVRKRNKRCKEHWISQGLSELEAEQIAHTNSLSSCQANEQYWLCRGYSEQESKELALENGVHFEAAHKNFSKEQNHFCEEYWIKKGYSKKDAKELAREANANATKDIPHEKRSLATKKWLQERTPEEIEKTNLRMSNKLKSKNKTHSPIFIEYWLNRGLTYTEAQQKVKEVKYLNSDSLCRASKIEYKFFIELQQFLKKEIILQKWVQIGKMVFCQDGRLGNIVFEFNGTNFHMDPRKYKNGDKNPVGTSYDEVKRHDLQKYKAYEEKKYLTIEIWEDDYKTRKEQLFAWIENIIKNEQDFQCVYLLSSIDM